MAKLECALADSLIKPMAEQPLLSIVIPTFCRPEEMTQTVQCLNDQLKDGLEAKVEILISDNGSDLVTTETIRAMAEAYPAVSFILNARDEGGFFNFFAAPWRARGVYTWVFGSDDLLVGNGLAAVVEAIEREQPRFMTLNKKVVNAAVSEVLIDAMNTVDSRRFGDFTEMFCAMGINQFAFISAQIEHTETARTRDAEPYLRADSRHPHVAFYLDKYAGTPAYYFSEAVVVHRNENSLMREYHAGNFFDFGVPLPVLVAEAGDRSGVAKGFLERISGAKRIVSFDPPEVTLIDAMFENILRAMAFGRYMTVSQRRITESLLAEHGREDRLAQFEQLWAYSQRLERLEKAEKQAESTLKAARDAALQTSTLFTQSTRN